MLAQEKERDPKLLSTSTPYTRLAIALVSLSARCMYDSNSIITLDRRLSESQMRKHIIQLEQNNQRQKEIIQNLRTQLNACNRKTISVQSDQVHDEDAVLITCKNLKRILYQQSANQKCTFCANEVQEVVIQKRTGRLGSFCITSAKNVRELSRHAKRM